MPIASDEGWKLQKVQPIYEFINLRALPTVFSDRVAQIQEQDSLQYIHKRASSEQPDGTWYPIMSQDKTTFVAWVRSDVIKFEPFAPAIESDTQPTMPTPVTQPDPQPTTDVTVPTTSGNHIKLTLRITPADGVDIQTLMDSIASISIDGFEVANDE